MCEVEIKILNNTSFEIEKGELVCILVPLGAGKTTLLNILGEIDMTISGTIYVDGKNITKLTHKQVTQYKRNDIDSIFRFYNLIQNLTALEDIQLAVQLCKDHFELNDILNKVGLNNRKNKTIMVSNKITFSTHFSIYYNIQLI